MQNLESPPEKRGFDHATKIASSGASKRDSAVWRTHLKSVDTQLGKAQ